MNADLWFNPRITPRVRSWLVSVLVAGAAVTLWAVFA
jgi:hypothetical protein